MINANRLNTFLTAMEQLSPQEWAWGRTGQFWQVDYRTSYPPFRFLIEFNDEMLYVQYIFQEFRIRGACLLALYRVLLRLNEEISLAKFGLTAGGNITLMGELPVAQCSLDTFQNLLRLMAHYLEHLYWEIGIVAESPMLADFLTNQEVFMANLDEKVQGIVKSVKVESLVEAGT